MKKKSSNFSFLSLHGFELEIAERKKNTMCLFAYISINIRAEKKAQHMLNCLLYEKFTPAAIFYPLTERVK